MVARFEMNGAIEFLITCRREGLGVDPYKILGIGRNATAKEIKAAYLNLSNRLHPDRGGDSQKFKEISDAYELLINEESRRLFDENGVDAEQYRSIMQSIESMLVNAFTQEKKCPIRWMCDQVDRSRSEVRVAIQSDRETLVRLKGRLDKFKRDNARTKNVSSRDFIVSTLADKCEYIESKLRDGEVQIRKFDLMLAFFNDLKSVNDTSVDFVAGQFRQGPSWSPFYGGTSF